ncbi:MAG: hypothetical protein OER95_15870, partial [Acidimicrobiia bacterium]|nr:hypothetical protein [Acidimicrobiia bacterium]
DSKAAKKKKWRSRAVLRLIEAGSTAECPQCGERVKFRARHRDQQVICNVYVDGTWDRVEQYHDACYLEAGEPHGEAIKKQRENLRQKAREKANQHAARGHGEEEAKEKEPAS